MRTFLLVILFSGEALATNSLLIGGADTAAPPTSTNYVSLVGGATSVAATESNKYDLFPTTGTLSNFRVKVHLAPGGAASYTYTVRKGAANTAMAVTISGSNTSGDDNTSEISVVPGNILDIQVVPSGTPVASTMTWTAVFTSAVSNESVLIGNGNGASNSVTHYFPFFGANTTNVTEANVQDIIASSGTISRLFCRAGASPGSGKSRAQTLRVNGSDTAITCTVSNTAQICNNQADSVHVVPGDLVNLKTVPSGTPTSAAIACGVTFTADHKGEFNIGANRITNLATSGTQYTAINTMNALSYTNEQRSISMAASTSPVCSIDSMLVRIAGTAGAGKSYAFSVRQNKADPASQPSVTISGTTDTYGRDDSHYISLSNDDYLGIQIVATGTPTARNFRAGFRGLCRPRRIIKGDL